MNLKCGFTILVLFLAAVLRVSPMIMARAGPSVISVPNDYPTIQGAINAAPDGSTIQVNSGAYTEQIVVNKTLTLVGAGTDNTTIYGSVTVTADNTVIEGFTIRNGTNGITVVDCNGSILSENVVMFNQEGIILDNSNSSIISGNIVKFNDDIGIGLFNCDNDTVSDNVVSITAWSLPGLVTGEGIGLSASLGNTISDNFITESALCDLTLDGGSDNNAVFGNVIQRSEVSLQFVMSGNNTIFGNNFLINPSVTGDSLGSNVWSVGGRGNYWDDYTGLDDGSGGRVASDGVGDTNLPWHGVDYYPLISPANPLQVLWNNELFPVSMVSNSTVSSFNFDAASQEITFNVNGPADTTGFFNVSVPTDLLSGSWTVLLNGTDVTSEAVITENQTYTSIYLGYSHSIHSVQLIGTDAMPEYATATALPLLTLAGLPLLMALAAEKRKKNKQAQFRKSQIRLFFSKIAQSVRLRFGFRLS